MIQDSRLQNKMWTMLVVMSLVALLLHQTAASVFAQVASSAGNVSDPTPTPHYSVATSSAGIIGDSPTPTPQDNPFIEPSSSVTVSTSQDLLAQSLVSLQTQNSASVRQPPIVGRLAKHSFKNDEKVSVTVGNQQPGDINVTLLDDNKKQIDPGAIDETTIGTQTLVSIDPSQFAFHPGKYTLKITDSTGSTTTQDFTWGVLAINTNKSYYLSGDNADISIGVLDDTGTQVCNAKVTLDITSPSGTVAHFSTEDKSITVNPQCFSHNMSLTPDYEAHFATSDVGDYDMNLAATIPSGTNTSDETLHVVKGVPFDVERVSATRLFPENTYPMIFHITANQDFTGTVVETVPTNFSISPYASQSAQTFTNTSLVIPIPNAQSQFGVPSLTLGLPFKGNYQMVQGFGVALTDPLEKAYYAQFGLAGHDGLDFALPTGTKVLATDDGVVVLAGEGAYGTTIVIQHSWGKSYYGHLSNLEAAVGDHVTRGEEIGLSGATGHVTGPHLHFTIKPYYADMKNGFYGKVDPTAYLANYVPNVHVLGVSTANVTASEKIITWNVALKKGDSIGLAYNYQSPQMSPAFFNLGPLKFVDQQGSTVFGESRQWELAIDANSTATNSCGAGSDYTGTNSVGTVTWTNTGVLCSGPVTLQNTSTSSTVITTTLSHFLAITGFGFSIPSTAKIIGISFSVDHWAAANASGRGVDNAIRLMKAGTVEAVGDHASGTNWNTSAGTPVTYGTASDLWSDTWTASDINNAGFGIAVSVKGTSSSKGVTGDLTSTLTTWPVSATITFDAPPGAPTGLSASSVSGTSESLQMHATDAETDSLEYKVIIYNSTNGTCTGVKQTDDQTSSQTGWNNTSYASGATATYTATGLTASTTYDWNASAIDPSGSNAFGSSSSCSTFTTSSGGAIPTLLQLMKHGDWFNSGVEQPFYF